jgi:hypothetical protein
MMGIESWHEGIQTFSSNVPAPYFYLAGTLQRVLQGLHLERLIMTRRRVHKMHHTRRSDAQGDQAEACQDNSRM